jgi:hypothetical protein
LIELWNDVVKREERSVVKREGNGVVKREGKIVKSCLSFLSCFFHPFDFLTCGI